MLLRSSGGAFKVHLGALGKAEAFAKVSAKPGVFASPLAQGFCFGRVDSILRTGYHFHTKILNHRDSDVKFSPFFPQIRFHKVRGCAGDTVNVSGGVGVAYITAEQTASQGTRQASPSAPLGACGHVGGQGWLHSGIPSLTLSLWHRSLTSLPSSKFLFVSLSPGALGPG